MTELFHYTCRHGHEAIGAQGLLHRPEKLQKNHAAGLPPHMRKLSELIWLTDLDVPHAAALGLTSHSLSCDRTEFRYRFVDVPEVVAPWLGSGARRWNPELRTELESVPGVMPRHWWIAHYSVRVEYAPIGGEGA